MYGDVARHKMDLENRLGFVDDAGERIRYSYGGVLYIPSLQDGRITDGQEEYFQDSGKLMFMLFWAILRLVGTRVRNGQDPEIPPTPEQLRRRDDLVRQSFARFPRARLWSSPDTWTSSAQYLILHHDVFGPTALDWVFSTLPSYREFSRRGHMGNGLHYMCLAKGCAGWIPRLFAQFTQEQIQRLFVEEFGDDEGLVDMCTPIMYAASEGDWDMLETLRPYLTPAIVAKRWSNFINGEDVEQNVVDMMFEKFGEPSEDVQRQIYVLHLFLHPRLGLQQHAHDAIQNLKARREAATPETRASYDRIIRVYESAVRNTFYARVLGQMTRSHHLSELVSRVGAFLGTTHKDIQEANEKHEERRETR